jgi:hypothetical protein
MINTMNRMLNPESNRIGMLQCALDGLKETGIPTLKPHILYQFVVARDKTHA